MKRQPSLHITEDNLVLILKELGIRHKDYTLALLAKTIATKAKTFSMPNRKVSITTEKLKKDISKLTKSNRDDAVLFSKVLVMERRKANHRSIQQIKPGSPEWKNIKDITATAVQFCEEFDLDRLKGFSIYIGICLTRIKKFSVNKLISMYPVVAEVYQANLVLESDTDPIETKKAHDIYNQVIIDKTGMAYDYSKDPVNYQYFVKVKDRAKELGISSSIYIKAQFHALEWIRGVPQPIQLTGDKADDRVRKYLYEKGLRISNNSKGGNRISFSDILKP